MVGFVARKPVSLVSLISSPIEKTRVAFWKETIIYES